MDESARSGAAAGRGDAAGDLDVFITGNVSRGELEAAGAIVRTEFPGGIFTAFLPVAAIDAVAALPGVERIKGAVTYEENLNASLPTTMADIQRAAGPGFAGANGAGVLVGDIDSASAMPTAISTTTPEHPHLPDLDQLTATGPAPSVTPTGPSTCRPTIDATPPGQGHERPRYPRHGDRGG